MADNGEAARPPSYDCTQLDDSAMLYWQQKGVELKASEATRIAAASEKWTGVLSAIAGIAVVTGALTSYDELRTLSGAGQALVVLTLLTSLALIVYANFLAYEAEVGSFKTFQATAQKTCNYFMNEPLIRVAAMKRSRVAALAGLVLLLVSLLALGLLPRESSAKSYVAIQSTGETTCGVLQTDASGIVSILAKTGGEVVLRIEKPATLAELIEVPSCGRQ